MGVSGVPRWLIPVLLLPIPVLVPFVLLLVPLIVLLPAVGVSTDTDYHPWSIDAGFDGEPTSGEPFIPDPGAAHVWPLQGGWVTSQFGWRTDPFTGDRRYHHGVDVGAPYGALVRAAAGGRVTHAGWVAGYGLAVAVSHGDGTLSVYGHLGSAEVRRGDTVTAGQVIGRVGSTGRSTGPHLHFEWRVDGRAVDPLAFYRKGG